MIYIVNGYPCSGKTTFEDMVCSIMGENKFAFKISTVDFVKEIAKECGWDGTKDLRNRKFLSDLKDLLTEWNDVPYKKIEEFINGVKAEFICYDLNFDECAIFVDCREPQEIKKLCEGLSAKSMIIRRPDIESNIKTSNHADSQVLDYIYDIEIINDGNLLQLADKAFKFVEIEHLYKSNKDFQLDLFGNIT